MGLTEISSFMGVGWISLSGCAVFPVLGYP